MIDGPRRRSSFGSRRGPRRGYGAKQDCNYRWRQIGTKTLTPRRSDNSAVRKAGESFLSNLDAMTAEQMYETAEKSHVLDDEKVSSEFAI